MLNTLNKVAYKAFGLNMISEISLPELPMISDEKTKIDILIKLGNLKEKWMRLSESNRYLIVENNEVYFQVPNTATYLIKNGNTILVDPMEGSDLDHLRLYLLGTCMGALLMQRKILPLHGSAVAINGKAYAIVGDSGAGKSTLASAFLRKGYQLLSDDVIPVYLSDHNIPIVPPAYPQQKLWQESLDAFGMKTNSYRPIFDRETKFAIPVISQFSSCSLPLGGVFELVKTLNNEISISPISNLERLHTLFYHTYRNFLIPRLDLMNWHFQLTAQIANQIKLFQIQRPVERFTANDLTALILEQINKE
ncbi:hypothetical protein DFO70_11564 [Cytobacillus firmus]|uniref:Aldolase n=2 Tax=Cytobacillus TaxID=2675230 RepID=A0A366JL84_CYTFI|nr:MULTISPECIES: aldolase [Cytobacillus]RBP88294.1 hypothetical protein DFO70_11564 [Cytobacillus firmus]TDX38367.1 hypothetical protein DFO72_11364 [Cytobacillus oceanisediminis]